jgi:hypothetical protein
MMIIPPGNTNSSRTRSLQLLTQFGRSVCKPDSPVDSLISSQHASSNRQQFHKSDFVSPFCMIFVFLTHSRSLRRPTSYWCHATSMHPCCAHQLIPPTQACSHHRDVQFVHGLSSRCQDPARNGPGLHRRQGRGVLACCLMHFIHVCLTRIRRVHSLSPHSIGRPHHAGLRNDRRKE